MYSHLVFTGGGMSGISYIGVIRYMQENGLHKSVHEVAGTSVGAMFACLFAMNIMAGELEEYYRTFFQKEENGTYSIFPSMMSLWDKFGMDDGERLVRSMRYFAEKKYHITGEFTFRDFVKRTGINFVVCASNVSRRVPVYFSTDTTPDVSIYDAIKASMCVPIMTEPVRIQDELYVDGALCDNTPVAGFRKSGQSRVLILDASQAVSKDVKPDTFMNYISIMFQMMIDTKINTMAVIKDKCPHHDILALDTCPVPFIKLNAYDDGTLRVVLTEDDFDGAVVYGYMKMYEFMKDKFPALSLPPEPPVQLPAEPPPTSVPQ